MLRQAAFGLVQHDAGTLAEGHNIITATAAREAVYRIEIVADDGIIDVAIAVDLSSAKEAEVDIARLAEVADVAESHEHVGMELAAERVRAVDEFKFLGADDAVL